MSDCAIQWLLESLKQHGDGTFSSAPKLFFQFYIIFGQKNLNMILPCSYCFLPNKTQETYIETLNAIKIIVNPFGTQYNLTFCLKVVLTDFELAIQNAFKHCFPGIELKEPTIIWKILTSIQMKKFIK